MGTVKKQAGKGEEISALRLAAENSVADCNVLLREPAGFAELLTRTLKAAASDLADLETRPDSARRAFFVTDSAPDSADLINTMAARRHESFQGELEAALIDALSAAGALDSAPGDAPAEYFLAHAARLFSAMGNFFPDYINLLGKGSPELGRINPAAAGLRVSGENPFLSGAEKLRLRASSSGPFRQGAVFRCSGGEFYPAELAEIRPAGKFFGFTGVRARFHSHFKAFSEGRASPPLFISSLPGLGKTHMTISHILEMKNLTLILPGPDELEKPLERMLSKLAAMKNRRFAVFFDDINTDDIDWYWFRTNVGGSGRLPENVTVAAASNLEFPASVLSRGVPLVFPVFDEIRCQEMVADFLAQSGVKKPGPALVSVIAADYVEEFGQKKFDELSPRSLTRYLERYDSDMRLRKRMLDLSKSEVITKPDSQIFFETNARLLRAVYGAGAESEIQRRLLPGRSSDN
jgi:hypothetical protein